MGFVMVPVPEEHVEEAMTMILRIAARARLKEWDQAALSGVFQELDEPSKSVLSAVTRATLAKNPVDDVGVAEATRDAARTAGIEAVTAGSVAEALAGIAATTPDARVLICGSLYLAGTVLRENG